MANQLTPRKDNARLGVVTSGSLSDGLEMKLNPGVSVEAVRAGKFVVVEGKDFDFFSMITDVRLDASSASILRDPPLRGSLLSDVLAGDHTYATLSLKPMLMVERKKDIKREDDLRPVKSIPVHFSTVWNAKESDIQVIFGKEDDTKRFFNLGSPIDMGDEEVCLDLDRLIERSNGVFGKTGTGKTFLTRLILAGIIRNNKAVNLIFDMHSEYGWQTRKESGAGKDSFVKGLKNLFGQQVLICTLDPDSARARNVSVDLELEIPLSEIDIEDIAPLQGELNLHTTAIETAYILRNRYRKKWLKELLDQDPAALKDFAEEIGANKESLAALYRKLSAIRNLSFVVDKAREEGEHVKSNRVGVRRLISELQQGRNIDLEFGRVSSMLSYLLVANLISRRIHESWVNQAEKYMATQDSKDRPRPLMITIEEAHKFLNPAAARQTIFGTIARELRKYFVSLLVVDQRPSGIDDEILSQLGTRVTALLNDEKDINAVFTGVSGAAALRNVLASLDSKQQALILGHATPMPVVVKTREYGEKFYQAMVGSQTQQKAKTKKAVDLFPPE